MDGCGKNTPEGSPNTTDTRKPSDFPADYPSELELPTEKIRIEAAKKFPYQSQLLELCKFFITEVTPVIAGRMNAVPAVTAMSALLQSWLIHNCSSDNHRHQVEVYLYVSSEWTEFLKAIMEAARADAIARPATHTPRVRPREVAPTAWRNFHDDFERLATDEKGAPHLIACGSYQMSYVGRADHAFLKIPEGGGWAIANGVSDDFRERFQTLATRAGVALGSPQAALPYWFDQLRLYLTKNKSNFLITSKKGEGYIIERACEACATFCSWLEGRAFETRTPLSAETPDAEELPSKAPASVLALSQREKAIWSIIQNGSRGPTYCRELDAAGISPPRKGIWSKGPRTYEGAYKSGDNRLVHWIQDEKSKIRRRAELLGLAELAG